MKNPIRILWLIGVLILLCLPVGVSSLRAAQFTPTLESGHLAAGGEAKLLNQKTLDANSSPSSTVGLAGAIASLTLLSAGLQRLIEVVDGPISRITFSFLKSCRGFTENDISQVDPTRLSQAKEKIIIVMTFIGGTWLAFFLRLDTYQGFLPPHVGVFANYIFGLMISGGTEGSNSVIKYLQSLKTAS